MQDEQTIKTAAPFEAMQPKEGAGKILSLLHRLTVLRGILDTAPAKELAALCGALAQGDAVGAEGSYHALTAALLSSSARRVTGDIFKDFLFDFILEQPNRFSTLAACGKADPAVTGAMEQDLRKLQTLFALTGEQLFAWGKQILSDRQPKKQIPEKKYGSEENISRMAASAWGSSYYSTREKAKPRPVQEEAPAPEIEPWASWLYDAPEEKAAYAADEGLAVIYRLFLAQEDWGKLIAPLSEFHGRYGTGLFLKDRILTAADGQLRAAPLSDAPHWDELTLPGSLKEQLYANTLRFLHTGKGENVLLYGPEGMGKRELVLALSEELPELRIVLLQEKDAFSCMEDLRALQEQPFRFVALMEDVSLSPREYRRLKMACRPGGFDNVLLYATAKERPEDSAIFGLELAFDLLSQEDFCREVSRCVHGEGGAVNAQALAQYVDQWQEEGGELTLQAARRMAERLMRSREN